MDKIRRNILTAATATAATAAVRGALAQPASGALRYGFYEKNGVRIRYAEIGNGFPLLALPGRGLNSQISYWSDHAIDPMETHKNDFRVIVMDQRNAIGGESTGPVPIDDPWGAFADDHLGLMDHLGIKKFSVYGNCMSALFALKLIQRAPERVAAAVLAQPVGYQSEWPDQMYSHARTAWGEEFRKTHPEITDQMLDTFASNMFRSPADFTYVVSRDFVRNCKTPMLVLPDQTQAHSFKVAIEIASLAPNASVNVYPWMTPPELRDRTEERTRVFLKTYAT